MFDTNQGAARKGSVGSCKWQTITIYTCRAAQKKKKNKRNNWDYKLTFDSPIRSYPKHQMRYHSGVKKIVIDYNAYCKILRCMMSLSTKIPRQHSIAEYRDLEAVGSAKTCFACIYQ